MKQEGTIKFVAEDYNDTDMSFDVIHSDGSKTEVWMPNTATYGMPDGLSEDSTPYGDLNDGELVSIEAVGSTENYKGTEHGTLFRVLKV